MPNIRVSKSDEEGDTTPKTVERDKNRRRRDRRIQEARREKRDNMSVLDNRSGGGAGGVGYGNMYRHAIKTDSSEGADDGAVGGGNQIVFPDAQLKLSFPHIKLKLQERLAQRHAAASMESHHKSRRRPSLDDVGGSDFKTESFW